MPDGPFILAGNHLSFCDSLFLGGLFRRRLTFLAKSAYFTRPGLIGRFQAWFFRSGGQIPTDRSGQAAGDSALAAGLEILANGGILCLYPEGTRSPDGRLYRGRTGIARLAVESGVPVVPVGIIGTDRVQPLNAKFFRLGTRPEFVFGDPMVFRAPGPDNDAGLMRRVTDRIMRSLRDCSRQEYVDTYSAGPSGARLPG